MQQSSNTSAHDLRMLLRKVEEGVPLTPDEKAAVDAAASDAPASRWAQNQAQLATALRISRQSVRIWRRAGAPAPTTDGRYDIAAWKEWAEANGRNERSTTADDKKTNSAAQAKLKATARRLLLQNKKLEIEIAILERKYLPADEVERDLTQWIVGVRRIGEQMPAALAPQVIGLDVIAAEKRLRDWWDEFLGALHRGEAEPKE